MPLINAPIGQRVYELIGPRIAEILFDEIDNQIGLGYETEIEINEVWLERTTPFGLAELPAINVSFVHGELSGQTAKDAKANYRWAIDIYTKAPSTDSAPGEQESKRRLLRLLGLCQSILEDTRYFRLGFAPPSIGARTIDEILIDEPEKAHEDLHHVCHGRLVFRVVCGEVVLTLDPVALAGTNTQIRLVLTDKGYKFEYNTPEEDGIFDETFDETFD